MQLAGICRSEQDMRPRTTNAKRRAFDAYQLSVESAGALGLQTNTQGPPSHGSLYRLRRAPRLACPCLLL